jgi:hypothetical protein
MVNISFAGQMKNVPKSPCAGKLPAFRRRGMNREMGKILSGTVAVSLMVALAACADSYEPRPLVLMPAVDCAQDPGKRGGQDYWLLGETGPRVIWSGCDKTGAELNGRNLATAELEGINLSGAQLRGADLGAANARGANLSDADLTGADVSAIYWRGAILRRANLTGLDLIGVEMDEVDLSGAIWTDGVTRCGADSLGSCKP